MKKAARARARDAAAARKKPPIEYTTWKFIFQEKVFKTHQSPKQSGNGLPQIAESSNKPNELHRKGLLAEPPVRREPHRRKAHGMGELETEPSLVPRPYDEIPVRGSGRNCGKITAPQKTGKLGGVRPSQKSSLHAESLGREKKKDRRATKHTKGGEIFSNNELMGGSRLTRKSSTFEKEAHEILCKLDTAKPVKKDTLPSALSPTTVLQSSMNTLDLGKPPEMGVKLVITASLVKDPSLLLESLVSGLQGTSVMGENSPPNLKAPLHPELSVMEVQNNDQENYEPGTVVTAGPVETLSPSRVAKASQNNDQEKATAMSGLRTAYLDPCLQVLLLVRGLENSDAQVTEAHEVCELENTASLVEEPQRSEHEGHGKVPVDWATFDFNAAPFISGNSPIISSYETHHESMQMEIETLSCSDVTVDSYYSVPNYEPADDVLRLWD